MSALRVLFMGTPDFAVPALRALLDGPDEVVGVVTQPDRPAGRRRVLTPPPVKVVAEEHGVTVFQPRRLLDEGVFDELASTEPDVAVVVAYGKILRPHYLDMPTHGCLNIHASLLPRWRGAAPINWAVAAGDTETGVTIQQMDAGLDTGPILRTWRTPIGETETAGELHDRLAVAGAPLVTSVLDDLRAGRPLEPTPQDGEGATYARMLDKSDGHIDWQQPAAEVAALVRGMTPWPGAVCRTPQGRLKLLRAVANEPRAEGEAGEVLAADAESGLLVAAGDDRAVSVLQCQRPGKGPVTALDYLNGLHDDIVGQIWTSLGDQGGKK